MTASVALGVCLLAVGCSGGNSEPDNPAGGVNPGDLTDVTHTLEPTDQMREIAAEQCLDDPELATGYVKAVDPDTDTLLTEFELDCDDVRAEQG